MDKVLLYFALKYQGDWDKIYNALNKKEKIQIEELEEVESKINCKYLTIINPLYPNSLKNAHKPPFVIFYNGDINLFLNHHRIVSFISDPKLTKYSEKEYISLVNNLIKENKVFLTNKEDEILNSYKENVIFMTNGISNKENDYGLMISEQYEYSKLNNKFDDRLLFSLPNGIIVLQIDSEGETMKKINFAINENKDIFVIPQNNEKRKYGNNWLIKQGAKLVEYPSDILNEL